MKNKMWYAPKNLELSVVKINLISFKMIFVLGTHLF